ncbi:hypothetical protein AAM37_gp62 [Pantoea phage vB_PagM_AAM37]|uniref:Uncharacterized protein n=1 Tax=Pantoea phage vB_PagM_AAM37 TaxID=2588093 RepID=A0A513ZYF5_9CAUD|nr:hypothetical protein HWC22_gp62 [Pantoea phage vB_PagM_AAM37]QDH45733.1 hypothetical protein AAM37_gp62 [Pantoea phage vB_PagM_AAM37]
MKERKITINGTSKQVTLTASEVAEYRYLAVDKDGEVWLFESKPYIECPEYCYWSPGDSMEAFELIESQESLPEIGDAWSDSATQIPIIMDIEAMADAIAALIRGRTVSDELLAEVTALIKAGN